jgi:hypothetical protein
MKSILGCWAALLVAAGATDERALVFDRCLARQTRPTPLANAGGYGTLDNCAALGNGCLMVSIAGGPPEPLRFFIGKTDFWRDCGHKERGGDWQSANVLAGYLDLEFPELVGGSFEQYVDLRRAEARTTLAKAAYTVEITSLTPHEADNFLINLIVNRGREPLTVRLAAVVEQTNHRGDPFELAAGAEQDRGWTTRLTHMPPAHTNWGDRPFRMWAAVATRVLGAGPSAWAHYAETNIARTATTLILAPGQTARVVTKVQSTGLPLTLTPDDPQPAACAALAKLTAAEVERLIAGHHDWWTAFWRKSFVRLDVEPLVERAWYGGLYLLGCANKVGQWPAGCNGWPVNDQVPWGGDYHWNYNHEATYYGAYSANHVELTEPYDRCVLAANEYGRRQAAALGVPGTYFFIATAPGHLNEPLTVAQRTHALEAALNLLNRYYYTHDLAWARTVFPFLKDVAAYWDFDLQQNKETLPAGGYRYVVTHSGPMEGAERTGDTFNGITGLAFLRRFYSAWADLTRELEANGFRTGYGRADFARWQDFLDHMSAYPMSCAYGRKVFAWSEATLNPFLTEQDWLLYPVFPGEVLGLGNDPALLKVARQTLIVKPQYYAEWLNNTPQIFAIAARLAHHPPEILERFNAYFAKLGVNNFKSGGGNVENAGVVEGLNNFLLQSHEGHLRLFPCWHHPDAKFETLRARGAFLVSAEKQNGVCQPFTITSEQGRACTVLNPWPGKTLQVQTERQANITVQVEARPFGQLCTFKTEIGHVYRIQPQGGVPAEQPWWNAAQGKPVTASSAYRPPKEPENWAAAKLTDGTRINTRKGHRGYTSALHDTGATNEWVQVDLGAPVPLKRVQLWPLDHGDAWQHTHCSEPFVESSELDQSYDGFPVDFSILVSADGAKWDEVARREKFRAPAIGAPDTDRKPWDVLGPERFDFRPRPIRFIKVEATKLRKTRYFGKYALQLAEIEAVRADAAEP